MASLIEPSSFDLIVVGTGLSQCIIAAAAASNGHPVLHLDTCDFYGSHWASLPFQDFSDWCLSAGQLPFPSSSNSSSTSAVHGNALAFVDGHAPASIETLEDQGMGASAQKETGAREDIQNEAESLGMSSDNRGTGEIIQHLSENQTTATEESNMPDQRGDHVLTPDEDGACCSTEASGCTDATDECILTSNANDASLPSISMEGMGLEPVFLEPNTCMYKTFNFTQSSIESLGRSRSYCIDLAGPKLAFCGGQLVDLLIRSGASNYLDFKVLESSFMWSKQGLSPVPSSRADIFKDRSLNNAEKRHLMRFFKLVVNHASPSNSDELQISPEDLESPFVKFLQGRQVPSSVQGMILYAIALAKQKQVPDESGQCSVMSTKEGMESLALYLNSVGRFVNAPGAFLYPLYGQGELSQAFSRCAAVKGALYALKMPIQAYLRDKETCKFKGVQMAGSNQLIYSDKLVVGPSMHSTLRSSFAGELNLDNGGTVDGSDQHEESLKVVRSVCITDKSLKPDLSTVMVVFPPESITTKEGGVIRALQLGSSVSVCPEGKFLVQLSMACSDESVGIEALQGAIQALFNVQGSANVTVEDKPTLLWAVSYAHADVYSQCAKWISAGQIAVCGMPDETLDYRSAVADAEKVFKGLYTEDVFFAERSAAADHAGLNGEIVDTNSYTEDTSEA